MRDWDWYVGRWRVQHRRLKERLIGSSAWEEFTGECAFWKTLGGLGNVDDDALNLPGDQRQLNLPAKVVDVDQPGGQYRAMTIRAFDAATGLWAIWWLDARSPHTIEKPVFGRFENGVGEFMGDDTLSGRPIRVRFRWTETTVAAPVWEQAFSADGNRLGDQLGHAL